MLCAATAALVFVPQLRNVITPQGPPELPHSKLLFPLHAWVPQLCVFYGCPRRVDLSNFDVCVFLLCLFFHLQQQLGSSGDFHFVRQKWHRHLCRSCHRRASHRANCYTGVSKFLKLHIAGLFRLGLFLGLATNGPIWMHGFIPTPSPLRLGLGIITVTIIGQLGPWS